MYPDQMTDAQKRIFDNIINPVKVAPRVKGRFKLRAMKGDIIMRESAWCPNIIVNGAFDYWFQNAPTNGIGIMGFVAGAGTATPQPTDTSLQSFLGGGGSVVEGWVTRNTTVSPRSITVGVRIQGSEGAVVGNVAEIALCRGTTGTPTNSTPIFNRARVVDEMGNPTTITVLSDEFLEVIYEITLYAIDGATGTLTINIDGTPTNFDYEIRPINMSNTFWWRISPGITGSGTGAWFVFNPSGLLNVGTSSGQRSHVTDQTAFGDPSESSAPAGYSSSNHFGSRVDAAYVPGSKERLQTIRLPLNNGNIAAPGIRSINLALTVDTAVSWCVHQMLLDGPFVKPATHIFDLPVTVAMDNA
ncbi:MAG TPA: hypothetical protein VIK69_05405 [Methylophilaceae bacterium]